MQISPEQFELIIKALKSIDTTLMFISLWLFLILVFKDCSGKK